MKSPIVAAQILEPENKIICQKIEVLIVKGD
jgi:hypothetical protein